MAAKPIYFFLFRLTANRWHEKKGLSNFHHETA